VDVIFIRWFRLRRFGSYCAYDNPDEHKCATGSEPVEKSQFRTESKGIFAAKILRDGTTTTTTTRTTTTTVTTKRSRNCNILMEIVTNVSGSRKSVFEISYLVE